MNTASFLRFLCFYLSVTCLFGTAFAQTPTKPRSQDEQFLKARVFFTETFGAKEAEERGVEIEHSVLKGNVYVESVISRTTLNALRTSGITVEVLVEDAEQAAENRIQAYFHTHSRTHSPAISPTRSKDLSHLVNNETPRNFKLGSMGGFYTLNEIYAEFTKMRELFPTLIRQPETIGTSVEGLPIRAYRICTEAAATARKPEVLYTAVHHAREPGGAASLIYFLWSLLEGAADGKAEAKYLTNNRQLYVVPVVNPDGYLWNQTTRPSGGGLWRKNRRVNFDGSFGVDLNRNYGTTAFWNAPNNGSSTNTRSDTYRGTEPFSEPETQAIRDFCARRTFRTAINFHTFSNLLIYPYSYINGETPDSTYFRALTAEITKENLYSAGRDMQTVGYAVRGASDDWMYAGLGAGRKIMAYTPEVGTPDDGFWPTPDRIIPHGVENLATNLLTAWSAGVNLRPVQHYVRESPQTGAARLIVETQNIGIQDAQETASLEVRSLTRNVIFVRPQRTLRSLRSIELVREVFEMLFDSTVQNGSRILAEIAITQEGTLRRDTVQVQVREARRVSLFSETAETQNWQLGRWASITDPLTGKPALTDSPQGLYRVNENTFVQLARPINLRDLRSATLEFQVRWSIESNGDLAVVQVSSDNGNTWQYLRTSLMKSNNAGIFGNQGGIGYDGNFPQWIRQEYPLDAWLGRNILVRFGIIADGSAQFDGMYVSDVALRLYSDLLAPRINTSSTQIPRVLPNVISQGTEIRVEMPLASIDEPSEVSVVNLIGQRVLTLSGINTSNDGLILLPTSALARGMYFVEVRTGAVMTRERILIL
jgi:carboxypeptidase T